MIVDCNIMVFPQILQNRDIVKMGAFRASLANPALYTNESHEIFVKESPELQPLPTDCVVHVRCNGICGCVSIALWAFSQLTASSAPTSTSGSTARSDLYALIVHISLATKALELSHGQGTMLKGSRSVTGWQSNLVCHVPHAFSASKASTISARQ